MKDNLRTSPHRTETPAEEKSRSGSFWELLLGIPLAVLIKGCLSRSFLVVLLSLLLFMIIMWLLKGSSASSATSRFTPPPGFVYVEPGRISIPPIDPGKIRPGRDSIGSIVSDRINVLLEKQNDSTGLHFQIEFKTLYPDSAYKFVYFDSLTYRMQIQVPEEAHDTIMDNLNSQMPDFEFLLFEESVFYASYQPKDPDFRNPKLSWYFDAIKCKEAWDITKGNKDIKVAIVDNGFAINHPEFQSKYVDEYNVPERNNRLYPPRGSNCPGHGTHVAGTAVGLMDNSEGVSGIAPECTLIPVQVATDDGLMSLTSILDGILYAIYKGAHVVNVSLGIQIDPRTQFLSKDEQLRIIGGFRKNEQRVWDEVFKIAENRNCTIVLAAGNENVISGFDAMKRNSQTIIVSAVDKNLRKADFSNYGKFRDVPEVYSTVSAPGVDIYNAFAPEKYSSIQGTSMAAPIVTGAVALIKSINPDLKTEEIINILQSTGIEMSEPIGNFIQLDKALIKVHNSK